MSFLPEELWRRILEIGIQNSGFSYKDLCCVSISCRRLRRLSSEDLLWNRLLSADYPQPHLSSSSSGSSKSLYKLRCETCPAFSTFLSSPFCFFVWFSYLGIFKVQILLLIYEVSFWVIRFERDKERRIAAHRRAVLRKESQIAEHSRRLREIQTRVAQETATATQTAQDLSNLRRARYSTHLIIHFTHTHTHQRLFLFISVVVEC